MRSSRKDQLDELLLGGCGRDDHKLFFVRYYRSGRHRYLMWSRTRLMDAGESWRFHLAGAVLLPSVVFCRRCDL